MKIKQSETIEINRSEIRFAPYNPRKENKKVVDAIKRNFKRVGYLGGIVWNKRTRNVVSGHKRVQTHDVIYDYPSCGDYKIKVECIDVDEKTEIEQNIFMNSPDAQGEFDNELLSGLISSIDTNLAGISDEFVQMLTFEFPNEVKNDKRESTEENGLKKREQRKDDATKLNKEMFERPIMVINFETMEDKAYVCERLKKDPYETYFNANEIFKEIL